MARIRRGLVDDVAGHLAETWRQAWTGTASAGAGAVAQGASLALVRVFEEKIKKKPTCGKILLTTGWPASTVFPAYPFFLCRCGR